ncbi:MAG: DNA-processing protein DprA [Candidatus Uhrbacteria bacterium]|nr:DNA-processing protein DprA [Patescibacteria group bacterium]MBU1907368.1 DNA-processing protein DprA [Patescibacteria group bacterium]
MENNELKHLLGLVRYDKFGAIRVAKLRNFFSTLAEAYHASERGLMQAGVEPKVAAGFIAARSKINPDVELELLERHNVHVIPFGDERYPQLLSTIYDPPACLFVRGNLPTPDAAYFSVVGSRKMTRYGEQATYDLIYPVAEAGLVITSGLALGVDAAAHQAALDVGGTTVAVLASGLDEIQIGPKQNLGLAHQIIERGGALVSEFPIGTEAFKSHFPFRNRIISGLARGVIVIEAAERSGTLITARSALEQGREVFAVPGPITSPLSVGPNNLIKMGAHPTTEAADILNVLGVEAGTSDLPAPEPESEIEKLILQQLSKHPVHVDLIIQQTKLETPEVTSTLTLMEMKGMVRHLGGMNYVKR